MTSNEPAARALLVTLACLVVWPATTVRSNATNMKSPALAKELQQVMAEKTLDAIAVADPEKPGAFIAVLVFPKVQLLAVAAPHASADYLAYQIQQKKYREVYNVLQQPEATPARVFFQDIGADGLGGAGGVDIMYDRGVQTVLDGKGKDAAKKLQAADERYSRMLRLAIDAARAHTVPPAP